MLLPIVVVVAVLSRLTIGGAVGSTITCGNPNHPENGQVVFTSLSLGSQLEFKCDDGYRLQEKGPVYCTSDGTWSSTDVKCVDNATTTFRGVVSSPTDAEHGAKMAIDGDKETCSHLKPNTARWLRIEFDRNHKVLSVAVSTSSPDKNMNFTISVIEKNQGTASHKECASFSGKFGNETVVLPCDEGKGIVGEMVHIKDHTKMDGILEICEVEVHVGKVSDVTDVNAVNHTPLKHADNASGDTEATESTVNEPEKDKDNVGCGPPPEVDGFRQPLLDNLPAAVGTEIIYNCDFGYVTQDLRGLRSSCKLNKYSGKATWTTPNVVCIPRSCGDPGYVTNGYRMGNLFTFSNSVEFQCQEGYKLNGAPARYCQANGAWSGQLPICEQVHCDRPANPEHGQVRYISLEYGTVLRYECDKGYLLKEHQQRTCTENGTWSNNDPVCVETSCEMPLSPEHGSLYLVDESKVGSIALYKCDDEKTLVGSSSSKCLLTGQWTFPPPKCLSSCVLTAVSNGSIGYIREIKVNRRTEQQFVEFQRGETFKHGGTAIFRCKDGFTPVWKSHSSEDSGPSQQTVTCEDGQWSQPLECKSESCSGEPPPIENGYPVVVSRSNGQTIYYRCIKYYVKPTKGAVKCVNGNWTGNPPDCVDGRCYTSQLNLPGLEIPKVEFIEHEKELSVSCRKGFKASKRVLKVSCNITKWTIPERACAKVGEVPWNATTTASPKADERIRHQPDSCVCTYNIYNTVLATFVKGERLKYGSQVKDGDTASLYCNDAGYHLLWPNGMHTQGSVAMTCQGCQAWRPSEFPSCEPTQMGDSLIDLDETIKVQPGGAIECRSGERLKIACINWNVIYPDWYSPRGVSLPISYDEMRQEGQNIYISFLNVPGLRQMHAGNYSCSTRNPTFLHPFRPTKLEFRIEREEDCFCIYNGTDTLLTLLHNGKRLIYGDKVRKGGRAQLKCTYASMQLILLNGTCTSGTIRLTCDVCKTWQAIDLPTCEDIQNSANHAGSVSIGHKTSSVDLSNNATPKPPASKEQESENNCFCSYHDNGKLNAWFNGVKIFYKKMKWGEQIQLGCIHQGMQLLLPNGTASKTELLTWTCNVCRTSESIELPTCQAALNPVKTCPQLTMTAGMRVQYTGERRVGGTATFSCTDPLVLSGQKTLHCRQDGSWNYTQPTCEDITCPQFSMTAGIKVQYTNEGRVGGTATFSCTAPLVLSGQINLQCLQNRTWSHLQPSCRDPGCLIGDFAGTAPENVLPNIEGVIGELQPVGSELPMSCENGLVITGDKKAKCGPLGKWNYGNAQCESGCYLNKHKDSKLIISPVQEYYRFGDFATLRCPGDLELTSDVERVMCMGSDWSDPIPDCQENKTDK